MFTPLASFLPPAASTTAAMVDRLFIFILIVCAVFFAIVTIGTVYLVIRYRRKQAKPGLTAGISHNTALEIIWSIIPGILVFIIFFWGFHVYMRLYMAPADAMEIRVTGRQWSWMFKYPDGFVSNTLQVPVHKPVKLVMSSDDVIHSLFIPDFRVKMDVLPYRYTTLWFQPNKLDTYDLFCTEYCGSSHSKMHTYVKVVTEDEFEAWKKEQSKPASGETLYHNFGCVSCHSTDGTPGVGPTWKGIYGHNVTVTENGKEVTVEVDDNYIRESILHPMAKVVKNFQPVMPPPPEMSSQDLDSLIDFIKSLKGKE